jgi:hypothetical protein
MKMYMYVLYVMYKVHTLLTAAIVLHELHHSVHEWLLHDGRIEGAHERNLHHLLQVFLGDLWHGLLQPCGGGWLQLSLMNLKVDDRADK